MKINGAKVGAVFYVLWAVIHVVAGLSLMWSAQHDLNGHLREIGTGVAPGALPRLPNGTVVSAIVAFHSFNMAWLGALVGVVAVRLNWRNSAVGFWLNLVVVGGLDVGLAVFLLLPGTMFWTDGLPGPTLFALGAGFTALGRWQARRAPVPVAGGVGGLRGAAQAG